METTLFSFSPPPPPPPHYRGGWTPIVNVRALTRMLVSKRVVLVLNLSECNG